MHNSNLKPSTHPSKTKLKQSVNKESIMDIRHLFHGPNAAYVLEQYEIYQRNPSAVDDKFRTLFTYVTPDVIGNSTNGASATVALASPNLNGQTTRSAEDKIAGVVNMANSIRDYGHLAAQIDPLGAPPPSDPSLRLSYHKLEQNDLKNLHGHVIGGPIGQTAANAEEAIALLSQVYMSTIGYDYAHITEPQEREWLRDTAESRRFHPDNAPIDDQELLSLLTKVDGFEQFLQRTYPGKTRFSIEGLDMMVPMLDTIISGAVDTSIKRIIIGMAHRGRLNVLAHVLDKPYKAILTEFKDPLYDSVYEGWSGDVKYHEGAHRYVNSNAGQGSILVTMPPNPSHLELVNPVLMGIARAAGSKTDRPGEVVFDRYEVMPILIHGDASFSGQGIVPETLNFSQVSGWRAGGCIHIIANNQVGFTTDQYEGRSTRYASDIAKGFKIPVIHVNADDPLACIEIARTALAFTATFERDILIDLVGYRRYGHNEGDEPRFTQPKMYQTIDAMPNVRVKWLEKLISKGSATKEIGEELLKQQIDTLQGILDNLHINPSIPMVDIAPHPPGAAQKVLTGVSAESLREYNKSLTTLPTNFTLHPRLDKIIQRRATALDNADEQLIDWGTAESLAFASILAEGTPIRITGEDVERGTFSHRHIMLNDVNSGAKYMPLQNFPYAKSTFEGRNSPLSENAAIGFEYGYDIEAQNQLVIWEGQYGDFVNGAQPVIDQYVVCGEAKWGLKSSLVMLLPHGYEGQGPDHSTGRLERFLQLAAETNMRIAVPTTAAQYFHLLRRQAKLLTVDPLPLIVMTPKSLLRHKEASCTLRELEEGHWRPVIDDPSVSEERRGEVTRLLFCSGKIYVDLVTSEYRANNPHVAIVRIEQLYRVPSEQIQEILNQYPNAEKIAWVQEEPKNMGAYIHISDHLNRLLGGQPLHYIGRGRRASPAEGSANRHKVNQAAIIKQAFEL